MVKGCIKISVFVMILSKCHKRCLAIKTNDSLQVPEDISKAILLKLLCLPNLIFLIMIVVFSHKFHKTNDAL